MVSNPVVSLFFKVFFLLNLLPLCSYFQLLQTFISFFPLGYSSLPPSLTCCNRKPKLVIQRSFHKGYGKSLYTKTSHIIQGEVTTQFFQLGVFPLPFLTQSYLLHKLSHFITILPPPIYYFRAFNTNQNENNPLDFCNTHSRLGSESC